jgi:photosystem II stability/assembly factor-like uncharacterized protein
MSRKLIYFILITIFLTNNLKAQWDQQYSGTYKNLYTSFFINSNTGYISGDSIILKTTNSGANWFHIWDNPGIINKLCFINEQTGWFIIHGNSSIDSIYTYKTTNGGNNWNLILTISPQNNGLTQFFIKRILFINENTGFITGKKNEQHPPFPSNTYGLYFKTTNSGNNWFETTSSDCYSYNDICFIDNSTGWMISDNLKVLKTTNCGIDWFTAFPHTQSWDLNSLIKFTNLNTGWFTESYPSLLYSYIFKSTNSGSNWEKADSVIYGKICSLNFSDANTGWICGYEYNYNIPRKGIIYATSNGGNRWLRQNCPVNQDLNTIFFVNAYTGWAAGNSGVILKTISGVTIDIKKISNNLPSSFYLSQNYPNPFNPSTNIKYQIKENAIVTLRIYDILGKEIETLVNQKQSPGTYEVNWDGSNYPSGVYFYKLTAGDFTETKKMILLK